MLYRCFFGGGNMFFLGEISYFVELKLYTNYLKKFYVKVKYIIYVANKY